MAKMIPSTIERNDPRRHGEYLVFDWFSSPDIPGVCFYSLPQKNHKHKMIGEVDFLYVCEKGILCVEVKGGQEIYREERQWHSVNHKGVHIPIKDPFVQSRDCMYALKKYIQETYGNNSVESDFQLGYCVIFPECVAKCKGNDIVTEVMFDNRYDLGEFKKFLEYTLDYWNKEEQEKHFGRGSKPLTTRQVIQMVNLLQADFGSVPSMKLEVQNVEEKMLSLSEEQMDIVSDMHDNKRVLVQGTAGTGKSLIALAKARQALAEHKNVLYLCFNRNMAQYAKLNLSSEESFTAKTFHSLLGEYIKEESHHLSIKELCEIFSREVRQVKQYDVLLVDEGQDLMYECVWDLLDAFIKGGFEKGEWVVFTDPNQSIFNKETDYQNGLSFLKELYSPTIHSLNKNWRNTAQIGRRTSRLTTVPAAKFMKVDGPKVMVRHNCLSNNDLVKKLRQDIHGLLMGGIKAKDIVILSPRSYNNSALASIGEMCNLQVVSPESVDQSKPNHINFFTVQSYKGLESSVVFYIDIPGFNKLEYRQLNYVAMSRARALLYMYVNEVLEEEFEEAMDRGMEILEE